VLVREGMVRASLLEELLQVVHGQPCLVLPTAHDLYSMPHAEVTCSLIDTKVIVSRDLLAAQFVPLLAAIGTLFGVLDGDTG
jgi:hypothetical protein